MSATAVFARYVAAFNSGDVDAIAALYATQTSFVNPFSATPLRSPTAIRDFVGPMFAAYSDMAAHVDALVADDEQAAARLTITARHTGDVSSPTGVVRASGHPVEMRTAEFVRVDTDGLITEHVRIFDTAAVLAQLETASAG